MTAEELLRHPWRQGRKVQNNVYAQLGAEPDDADPEIGVFFHPELAREAVEGHNWLLLERSTR